MKLVRLSSLLAVFISGWCILDVLAGDGSYLSGVIGGLVVAAETAAGALSIWLFFNVPDQK